ncbi:MAG TPA: TatD family hydrolase [Patescibacteria group bacterium]|nr:TatD family hydrolase [Patescibacteria group bacterium]
MQLIDTHCHIHESQSDIDGPTRELWLKAGNPKPEAIVADAVENDVTDIICVGTTVRDSYLAVDLAKSNPRCWASIGVHPHEAHPEEARLGELNLLVKKPKVVAIGECGLDYLYNHSPKQAQVRALKYQIELALENSLPMVFHVREAFDDFWPIFDSYKGIRGVLHSFTDTKEQLDMALERGLYIGVNGIMTFTKNDWQLEIAKAIPADRLLLETDAPYLTPVPFRGKVNAPANVKYVAQFMSELREESLNRLADTTTQNARQLFSI